MNGHIFRYEFGAEIPKEDIEDSLLMALVVTEVLHGHTDVRLETRYCWDGEQRRCVIDATTRSGHDFNRIFAGLVIREFGDRAFSVERVASEATPVAA